MAVVPPAAGPGCGGIDHHKIENRPVVGGHFHAGGRRGSLGRAARQERRRRRDRVRARFRIGDLRINLFDRVQCVARMVNRIDVLRRGHLARDQAVADDENDRTARPPCQGADPGVAAGGIGFDARPHCQPGGGIKEVQYQLRRRRPIFRGPQRRLVDDRPSGCESPPVRSAPGRSHPALRTQTVAGCFPVALPGPRAAAGGPITRGKARSEPRGI